MVEPHALVHPEELSLQINRQHVNYLQADESPQKLEQRTKLESSIRKYLCLVAHGRKFIFDETADVLRISVASKSNFSAYRASTAFNAIARYAANLVAQPWRKEFRVIKTFSGFYMHDIEENLAHADHLLDCMGYRRVDHSSLVLEQPIDIDAVINVSRDAIVAFVECQIMKEIWEGVYPQFECSWREILNFRESHPCSPESAIKSLSYQYHQNCFHQQMLASGISHDPYNSTPRMHHHSPQASCLYGQQVSPQVNMPYYGLPSYPSCVVPQQPRYACVTNPQQMMGYPMSPSGYHQHVKSPIQVMPNNGYHFPPAHQMMPSLTGVNGYVVPQPSSTLPQSYNCVVPTGQLIELDSNTSAAPSSRSTRISMSHLDDLKGPEMRNGNAVAVVERPSNLYSDDGLCKRDSLVSSRMDSKSLRPNTLEDLKPRRNGFHNDHAGSNIGVEPQFHVDKYGKQIQRVSSRKSGVPAAPMQDGTGTWESWDYVYRNLESQGYNKDVGERGDILHTSTFPRRGSFGSAGSSPNVNNTVFRNSRNIREPESSIIVDQSPQVSHLSDGFQSLRLNSDDPMRGVDAVDSRHGIQETKGSSVKEKAVIKSSLASNKMMPKEHRREMDASSSTTLQKEPDHNSDLDSSFWECVFCTFHNKGERLVCEMCGKSRQPGNEDKPLVSGGRECPKCTLVNARGVVSCVVCHENLKNSPTYI